MPSVIFSGLLSNIYHFGCFGNRKTEGADPRSFPKLIPFLAEP